MGWDVLNHKPVNAKQFLDKEFTRGLVKSAMIGNQYYAAIKSEKTGEVFGLVVIVEQKRGEFAYKAMSEEMGPYFHKCPTSILKLLTPTTYEYAIKWRELCAQYHATKNATKTIKNGDVIKFTDVISFGPYGTEQTFTVRKDHRRVTFIMEKNGMLCRISNWRTRQFTVLHKAK